MKGEYRDNNFLMNITMPQITGLNLLRQIEAKNTNSNKRITMEDIHSCAKFNKLDELVRAIREGVNINEKDEFGATALHYAIAYKNEKAISILLANNPDLTLQNKDGKTVLHSAIEYKLLNVAEELLKMQPLLVSVPDNFGNEPLWTACFNAHRTYDFVVILLKYKANVTAKNNAGLCPIDIAERMGDSDLLNLLRANYNHEVV